MWDLYIYHMWDCQTPLYEIMDRLEAPCVPHALIGVMAQNIPSAAKAPHVWSTGNQEIK